MERFIINLLTNVEHELLSLERQSEKIEDHAETAISILQDALEKLKGFLRDYQFKNLEEEVTFFKELKPTLCSRLIFYNQVRKIESKKPPTVTQEYYLSYLNKINDFHADNVYLYQYLRMGANYFDEMFFTRQQITIMIDREDLAFEIDTSFTTMWDHRVAQVLANVLLASYLNKKLDELGKNELQNYNLTWQESKRAIVLLIYALVAKKCFGNARIKDVANWVESTLNIKLDDIYNIYKEIKWEKINRTEFLDELKIALLKKMDEENTPPYRGE